MSNAYTTSTDVVDAYALSTSENSSVICYKPEQLSCKIRGTKHIYVSNQKPETPLQGVSTLFDGLLSEKPDDYLR